MVASMVVLAVVEAQPTYADAAVAFGNGIEFMPRGLTNYNLINGIRASGFNTMVIFAMSVDTNGNFVQGGQMICSNGVYTGDPTWGGLLARCKVAPTSVNRIEMCIGGWGDRSFLNIKNLIAADGTNSTTDLYRNLVALKNALGINAIDYDDEYEYDSVSAISFGKMCAAAGLKVTLCPYTNPSYWQAVKSGLGTTVDFIYLQGYSGGAGNDPASWASDLGVPVSEILPGDWDADGDLAFLNLMQGWGNDGCTGGFYWPLNSGGNPPASSAQLALYAVMIHAGLKSSVYWQGGAADYDIANNWAGGVIPGGAANAINDGGSNNIVQINTGDPIWNVNGLWAGSASNATGAYVQNGSTVNVSSPDSWFRLGGSPGAVGYYTLNAGVLNSSDNFVAIGDQGAGILNINGGMANLGNVILCLENGSTGTLNLNGGVLRVAAIASDAPAGSSASTVNFNGGTIQASADNTNFISGLTTVKIQAGGVIFNSQAFDISIPQVLAAGIGGGGLTKMGPGRLTLSQVNRYTGATMVDSGTLALVGFGSIGASTMISISNDAVLDVTGRTGQTLTISKGLRGSGTILGKLYAAPGSTVYPGDGIGTMVVQDNVVLKGTLVMEINRTNSPTGDQLVSKAGSITAGGTLVVTNLGPALQAGDQFPLFTVPVSGFASVSLPRLPPDCAWINNLSVDGAIRVVSTVSTNISTETTNNTLTLSWPADHRGWTLQAQTNSLDAGFTTNWVDVPDSTNVNRVRFPINPTNGCAFFRLIFR